MGQGGGLHLNIKLRYVLEKSKRALLLVGLGYQGSGTTTLLNQLWAGNTSGWPQGKYMVPFATGVALEPIVIVGS